MQCWISQNAVILVGYSDTNVVYEDLNDSTRHSVKYEEMESDDIRKVKCVYWIVVYREIKERTYNCYEMSYNVRSF